jgi:hypothetical protein
MGAYPFQDLIDASIKAFGEVASAPFFSFLRSWLKRLVPLFLVFFVVVSLFISFYTFFRQQRDHQLKFFVSGGTGSGADEVNRIQTEFKVQRSFLGPNYLATEFRTGGSLDSMQNVRRDQEGNAIGIAVEGIEKNATDDLRTLVPLQWCYLHFICRLKSLHDMGVDIEYPATADGSGVAPIPLSVWAKKYRENIARYGEGGEKAPEGWPFRVYVGQRNSGTRQIAEMVLENAGVPLNVVEASSYIEDIESLPEELARGRIDGAFVLERRVATEDLHCTLLSLDNVGDLRPDKRFLATVTIPPHIYDWSFWQDPNATINKRPVGNLHLTSAKTLAARRVLVASSRMSDSNAYYLAGLVRGALDREQISEHSEDSYWPAPDDKDIKRQLNYPLHTGVVWNAEPGLNWFGRNAKWLGPLLLAIAISLITEIKNRVPGWLSGRSGASDPVEPPRLLPAPTHSAPYAEIESRIEKALDEIHDARDREIDTGEQTSADDITRWRTQIGELYRHVHLCNRAGQLVAEEKNALNMRLLQARDELELLSGPPWRPGTTRARRSAKKSTETASTNDVARAPGA